MISANLAILMMTLLIIKHFIADFPLQKPWHYENKGSYMHVGGIDHAFIHASLTAVVLIGFCLYLYSNERAAYFVGLALVDGFIHYHIDWAKMNLNRLTGWKPDTHNEFWVLLGIDQMLHYLTYVFIVWCYI